MCFRYRYLYHLLKQRNEVIPIVVSEWYGGGTRNDPEDQGRRGAWYDKEAAKDFYHWAWCPFTLGPSSGWIGSDYEVAYKGAKGLMEMAVAMKGRQNAICGPTEPDPEPDVKVMVGMHDAAGGDWLKEQSLEGYCLAHWLVTDTPQILDFTYLQQAGIKVIARVCWGYGGGGGTFPRPEFADSWVANVAETANRSRGVYSWHFGNEPNNRIEWPGFLSGGDEYPLTPEYTVDLYNKIWNRVNVTTRMGPPPLDPYFGPGSDNSVWWMYILDHIAGADDLFLHSKTQTNDAAEVWSREMFSDDPLKWQYLHLRTIETYLAMVPDAYRDLPVFVTELNPQHQTQIGGALGWTGEHGPSWVREAMDYFRWWNNQYETQPVHGVMFYRYDMAGDQSVFGLRQQPGILTAITQEALK
jgi:hypothetical protein